MHGVARTRVGAGASTCRTLRRTLPVAITRAIPGRRADAKTNAPLPWHSRDYITRAADVAALSRRTTYRCAGRARRPRATMPWRAVCGRGSVAGIAVLRRLAPGPPANLHRCWTCGPAAAFFLRSWDLFTWARACAARPRLLLWCLPYHNTLFHLNTGGRATRLFLVPLLTTYHLKAWPSAEDDVGHYGNAAPH